MMYDLWQARQDLMNPWRRVARGASGMLRDFDLPHPAFFPLRQARAVLEVFGHSGITQERPPFALDPVEIGGELVAAEEEVVLPGAFGSLLHFRKEKPIRQPRVLVVAPMSGHFATLLRGTVQALLPDNDVYITDWHNARDIPRDAGRFGVDEFVEAVMRYLGHIGPGAHVLAVCQPVAAVLAAVALMAEDCHRATPRSMTLMAGPIDTRISPTQVNELANSKSIEWFERNLIHTVPWWHKGGGRRVYPGALQLSAFMSMNLDRHKQAFRDQFRNLVDGEAVKADAHRKFYDEYLAVMDLPGEFYLETVHRIFQRHDLPLGNMTWRGRPVRPQAIRRTALMTVEGERDDICAVGQTMAALDLCSGIPLPMKRHHLQTEVGHYGIFSGRRWQEEIYPRVREMIQAHD
jgi:poly(3-hydroxybutyrate) depolymerase